ncbi:MAG: hypothetical protein ACXAC5_02000 [Promethearchaeota archaeon]
MCILAEILLADDHPLIQSVTFNRHSPESENSCRRRVARDRQNGLRLLRLAAKWAKTGLPVAYAERLRRLE